MRLTVSILSAFLTLFSSSAYAAGVLLPSNNTAAPLPNLGLMPKDDVGTAQSDVGTARSVVGTTRSDKVGTAQPQTTAPQKPPVSDKEAKALMEKEAEAALSDAYAKKLLETLTPQTETPSYYYKPVETNITPGGAIATGILTDQEMLINRLLASGGQPVTTKPRNDYEQRIQQYMKAQEESLKNDPTFIDDTPILMETDAQYPSSIIVGLSPNYYWGTEDTTLIERVLGYDAKTIPSQCQLRLRATILSDQSVSSFRSDIHPGKNETIGYTGNIHGVSFQPYAVCRPPRTLPRNGGIIMRTGDLFTLQLMGMGACSFTPNQSIGSVLGIQYMGNGKVTCKFGG